MTDRTALKRRGLGRSAATQHALAHECLLLAEALLNSSHLNVVLGDTYTAGLDG